MTTKHIFITAFLVGALCSCNSYKKLEKKSAQTTSSTSQKSADSKEMSLFFDAEKARLLGDSRLAFSYYQTMVESYPDNATARYQLAKLQFQRQDISGAEKNAQRAFELDSKNKFFAELYSEILIYQKKDKQAELLLNTLLQNNPSDEEYLYRRAMFHARNKEYDKSIQDLNQLENLVGFSDEIVLQRKNIYLIQKKTDKAIEEVEKLKKMNPQEAQYAIMVLDINRTAGRKDKVKEGYLDLEKNYANDPTAQVELAQHFFNENDKPRFNEFMQKVMKNPNLDPETKIALLIPMLKALDTGTEEEKTMVASMAKSIAQESPDNKDAVALNAEVLLFLKKTDEALLEFKKATKLDKTKFQNWNQIISIYLEKTQFDSALHYTDLSLELFPNMGIPYFLKGLCHVQLKQSEKAIKPFNTALELETENIPLQAQVFSLLGDVYNTQKNYTYSDSCFERALKLQPEDASTLNNYAYYLSLRKEKLNDAERMSKKSLMLMPESKSFLDTYGWILYQQGKFNEAKEYIERAIKAAGDDDATLLDHLGDIYFQLGDKTKALELWKSAKLKGADNPFIQKKITDEKLYE